MVATGLDLLSNLVPLHHINLGLFEVVKVQNQIPLVTTQVEAQGKKRAFPFLGCMVDFLIDAANNVPQQHFFFLTNAFAKHEVSLNSFFGAGEFTPIAA
jgi:hypothetical protein